MARDPAPAEWFLSYNSLDHAAVAPIRQALEAAGIPSFFDRESLTPGLTWFDEIDAALSRCRGALVFLGPSGLGRVQRREIQVAFNRETLDPAAGPAHFRLIPVILPGCDREKLPGLVALYTWIELRHSGDAGALIAALRRNGSAPPGAPPPRPPKNPFLALSAFHEDDAPLYFGRTAETAKLVGIVASHPFVAVVGPSGSGKSSLVQAGLLPRLRTMRPPQVTWDAIVFNPGQRPFYSLASALYRFWMPADTPPNRLADEAERMERQLLAGETRLASYIHEACAHLRDANRLLIVIDQFEELFTHPHKQTERELFLSSFLDSLASEPCQVVLTLRADYYGRAIDLSPRLTKILEQAQLPVGPLDRDNLRAVIEGPARLTGLTFDDGLVDRILDDVEKQPGSLPLLEFALAELWSKAPAGQLTHHLYKQGGCIEGAISKRADAVLNGLSTAERERAPALLTRLVRVAASEDEGANARQLLPLNEVAPEDRLILDAFQKARLLVFDDRDGLGTTVEVAHEALIRNWGALAGWIASDLQFLLWRQRLAVFLREWRNAEEDPSALLPGALLPEARRYTRSHGKRLSTTESDFLRRSLRRHRGSRYLRWAVAALLLVTAAGAGGYYYWTTTPSYLVHQAIQKAAFRDVVFGSRTDDDPHTETLLGWLRVLVRSGRADMARIQVREVDYMHGACLGFAVEREARSTLGPGVHLDRLSDGQSIRCYALLPLQPDERAKVVSSAIRTAKEGKLRRDLYNRIRDSIEGADGVKLLGDRPVATELAREALNGLESVDVNSRTYLLFLTLNRFAPLFTPQQVQEVAKRFPASPERSSFSDELTMLLATQGAELSDIHTGSDPTLRDARILLYSRRGVSLVADVLMRGAGQGRINEVMSKAEELGKSPDPQQHGKAFLFSILALRLSDAGYGKEALILANAAVDPGRKLPYPRDRSGLLADLAIVFARHGDLFRASKLTEEITEQLDRLRAFTAIVAAGSGVPEP